MHHSLPALCAMWTAMSVVMMAPLAGLRSLRFSLGYLAPWIAYGLGAAVLQFELQNAGLIDHLTMSLASPLWCAMLLVGAGLLQFSPLKKACLARCRASCEPTLREGLRRGVYSIGSCGALMLALFAVGVMNWPAMLILTLLLAAEHWLPHEQLVTRAAAYFLIAAGTLEGVGF
jgi:predicted metal-binding membrane protein